MEADGEWHTENGKYASAGWKANNPSAAPSARSNAASRLPSRIATPDVKPFGAPSSPMEVMSEAAAPCPFQPNEIISIDDSDDELAPPPRPGPSRTDTGNGSGAGPSRTTASVTPAFSARLGGLGIEDAIDLCDSDEEDEPAPRRSSLTPAQSAADVPLPPSTPQEDMELDPDPVVSPNRERTSLAELRRKRARNYAEDSLSPLSDDSEFMPPAKRKRLSRNDDERDDMAVDDDLAAVWGDIPAHGSTTNGNATGNRGNTSTADSYVSKPPGLSGGPRIRLNVSGRSSSNQHYRTPSPTGGGSSRNAPAGPSRNGGAGSSTNGSNQVNGLPTWSSFSKP